MEDVTFANMDELLDKYARLRAAKDRLKEESADIHAKLTDVEGRIHAALQKMDRTSYEHPKIGKLTFVEKQEVPTPKTIEEKSQVFDYINTKYGNEVLHTYLTINHRSLNAFYRQELEAAANKVLFQIPGLQAPTVRYEARFKPKRGE